MSLIKNTSIYLTSNILNAAIPFILLPILTRYLTPAEYGQIAMFQLLLSALNTFIGLNSVGAANRKFYDNVDNDTLKTFNGSCVQVLIITFLASIIFTFIIGDKLSYFLSIPIEWIYLAIIISAITFITTLRLGQWQIRHQAKYFGMLQVGGGILNLLISLQLVIVMKQGAAGRVDAQLISCIMVALISLILLYKENLLRLFSFKPKHIIEILHFGIPLIPHHIGFFLLSAIDRFFINKELGLSEAGIYMVAFQLSTSLVIFFDAINKAFVPWLFEKLAHNVNSEKIKIVKLTYLHFLVTIFVSIISFLIGPSLLVLISGEKYIEAGNIIGLLCLGQCFGGMYLMVTNYIFFSKKTLGLSLITVFSGLMNILLIIILINPYGLVGVAFSYSISKLIQFLLTWVLSYKYVRMPWFNFKIIKENTLHG
ncbi:TPA: lipopolysaccharide biosynthesis protein [Providencia alcalifaciens]